NLSLPRGRKKPLETWMRQMQNRKLADVVTTVGWSAGTATRCGASIGNIRAKHSSAVVAGWNTSQTTKLVSPAVGAIKSPRHQSGKPLNWCLVFSISGWQLIAATYGRARLPNDLTWFSKRDIGCQQM